MLFVEEPVHRPGAVPTWEWSSPAPNVTVCRPCTPLDAPGFGEAQRQLLERMMPALVARARLDGCVAWLYTPLALPLAYRVEPDVVVYDCMDELSGFLGASPELAAREVELFAEADLVFTGGRSLHRAKRALHPAVHCFPSSVDVAHFAGARDARNEPEEQRVLRRPRIGYFGVIDERLDPSLLDAVARAHPEWEVVMIGPVVKIDPGRLPRRPNIHWLGQRSYGDLPAYVAGWDVCLLPFARNAATRFISPTKTLEYMAAERPIVSTPITDVAEPYGDVVYLADGSDAFVTACELALAESPATRARRTTAMRAILACTSWDATVEAMERLVQGEELRTSAADAGSVA